MHTYETLMNQIARAVLKSKLQPFGGSLPVEVIATSKLNALLAKLPDHPNITLSNAKFDFSNGKNAGFYLRATAELVDGYLSEEISNTGFSTSFRFRVHGGGGFLKDDAVLDNFVPTTLGGLKSKGGPLPDKCEVAITALLLKQGL